MDGLNDLFKCMARLCPEGQGHEVGDGLAFTYDGWSMLGNAEYRASEISRAFSGYSTYLSQSWTTIGSFCDKVDKSVRNELYEVTRALAKYIGDSQQNVESEKQALDKANEEAETILKELGIE